MATTILVGATIGLLTLQVSINTLATWIAGKVTRISGASLNKALLVGGTVTGVNALLLMPLMLWVMGQRLWPADRLLNLVVPLAVLGISLLLPWQLIRICFHCGGGRAALATLVMLLATGLIGLPIAYGVRSWITEAFVIPTGNMAPSIIGAHGKIDCDNCGCDYTVGMSDRVAGDGLIRLEPKTAHCPNCGALQNLDANAPIYSGDRILVDKFRSANRWEPVAYVAPHGAGEIFLMRLVGLPGEDLAIVEGDLFIDQRRLVKPPDQNEDLWITVHDTSFAAKTPQPKGFEWAPASPNNGWASDRGTWKFRSEQPSPAELKFYGAITTTLAFNADGRYSARAIPEYMGDLRVDCTLNTWPSGGKWGWRWKFGGVEVTAEFDGRSKCTLAAKSAAGESNATGELAATELDGAPSVAVGFAIRDGQASLLLDGEVVASLEILPAELAKQLDAAQDNPCELTIVAVDCNLTLDRILMRRDVYYVPPRDLAGGATSENYSIHIAADELFVLGDNSDFARDSRYDGPFKSQTLIGPGRCIYWPPHRWHRLK